MAADGAGIRFGQYVLLRRIARGGMAEVFLAQQRGFEGFDRRVAVKRILPHLADAPDFIKMFLDEAKLAAQLSHPNIVHIYDFGKVDSDYFIAMEYVDGVHAGQLRRLGGETERLPPTMIARLGADAAAALHYAHELRAPNGKPYGLVHRDVSPANLMVSFDGVVKLCDFGIAKAAALGERLTLPGHVKGKYAYMSPEQTTAAPLDGRSDVYSLAVVMWELLTGKTIVPRGDVIEAMRAIRDGKFLSIDRAAPWTPAPLANAITWALQPKRQHRPTAMQFAQELEAFIKSSPELATTMQLGSWLRVRFPRDQAGQVASPPAGGGTQAAPGTLAAPGTGTLGKGPLIAASLVSPPSVITSDTTSETVAVVPDDRAADAATLVREAAAFEPTDPPGPTLVRDAAAFESTDPPGPTLVRDAAAFKPADPRDGAIAIDDAVTVMRSGASRPLLPSGPSAVPTLLGSAPAPVMRSRPLSVMSALSAMSHGRPATDLVHRRRPRRARVLGGLVGLAVLSFLIALAARGTSPATVATSDAAIAQAAPIDAQVDALPPVDAAPIDARAPTILPDADTTAILEVRTHPEGAMVKIGERSDAAPTQFTLPAGHYVIDAELEGWMPERRDIDLVPGQRVVQDIGFTTELPRGARRAQTGKLSVRTTPSCEVFLGTRSLGETPFTDLELEPGTYTLVFKHPHHQAVTRNVTITAGKTTKLSLALP